MALGPPDYTLSVLERGGVEIGQLPWESITWNRVLDDSSSATLVVPVASPDHPKAALADRVASWEHEVAIWRGRKLAWMGPVVEPTWGDDGLTIQARDVFEWLERRDLPHNRYFNGEDLARIFQIYVTDAMSRDPSPNITVSPRLIGVHGDREVNADEHKRAADELRELARNGLDFTVLGREILTGGEEVPTAALPKLTTSTLRNAKVREAGLLAASEVTVLGHALSNTTELVVGTAGGVDHRIGLVQRTFNEDSVGDALSAYQAAKTRWDMLGQPPWFLTGELVARRAPDLDRLVPGAVAPVEVRAGVKTVTETMRLSGVSFDVRAGQGGVEETVTAELIPLGTVQAPEAFQ